MELTYKPKTAWENLTDSELAEMQTLSQHYISFLNTGKTERECAAHIIRQAKEAGFKPLEEVIKSGKAPAGTKVYLNNKDKSVVMMVLGEDIMQGMNIVGAHIDSPRLDVKQMPLYEDSNLVFLKTHYYGGIKKYQWTAIPLAIHGVIFTKEGKKVEICIGEDENDPVLFINDLLIHLSKKQLQETLAEGITAEQLNVLVGNMKPTTPDESDDKKKNKSKEDKKGDKASPVKENILKILNQKYGITEEDFRVAELEIVPAGKARNVGLDNSMIAGHGHDDRVCAYTTLKAILEVSGTPAKTAVALFADKHGRGDCRPAKCSLRFRCAPRICQFLYVVCRCIRRL